MKISIYYSMIEELQSYKRPKEELLIQYMTQRLDQSLDSYIKDLNSSTEYLSRRNSVKLVRKINK